MSRKTYSFSAAAIAATMIFTTAYANGSDAVAQDQILDTGYVESQQTAIETELTEETVPVFVSNEVVQDVPEVVEDDVAANEAAAQASSLHDLVAMTSTDAELSKNMRCLAGAIYFESRGESLAGQLAVGQVIVNRAESARFPSDYCGVVYQRSQFSFVRGGTMPRIKTGSHAWQKAKAIAHIVHNAEWESEAGDSLYFHAKYVKPKWASRKAARATIERHIFYR